MDVNVALLAPELILATAGVAILLGDAFAPFGLPRSVVMALAIVGICLSAALAVPLLGVQASSFFGALAVDSYAVYFKLLFLAATLLVVLASQPFLASLPRFHAEFVGLLLFATVALMLLASANELITVYVSLEMSSLSIAFLAAWQKRALRPAEAGLKFFLLSAMASAVLLYGMALLYGLTGQTRLDAIARELSVEPSGPLFLALAMLVAGFGFKVSAVPFQMWTPDVYEGAPTPVTAYLSVASKAAGFAVAVRVFQTALPAAQADWATLFAGLAVATMTVGNLAALVQSNIKRMLAYSSIAQAGYILVGIAAASDRGIAAVLFYLLAYTATNLGAFIAVIEIVRRLGSEQISDFKGLHRRAPWLAFALAVSLLSLAGLPPFAGFFAKLYVFWAAAESGLVWLVLIGVVNSAISL
ncbi:MAG: NADH-quinone oxidoreductase subunit NuoN, partial [Chloroflexi bacterium]|nr:NADH-quinone oxidoreductase subunit NuoN [Chloroflexota bacterium]